MTLGARDQSAIWHPFTQHQTAALPLPIVRGAGAYLYDDTGKRYLDMISSWWVNLHGHSHPEIAKAIYEQAVTLEHVIFAGFTHEPAVLLAETLLRLLPAGFTKVFYSDSGSSAVEVALKMAYQYWHNRGEQQRKRFVAFENGYHGDTFGSMSVGKYSGFFNPFTELLFAVDKIPYPATWAGDDAIQVKEKQVLAILAEHLEKFGSETAAFILEPLVQGASGMHMCRASFLQEVEKLVRSHGVLIIYDEVMTGFGRTGDYFACLRAETTPDIICLAKGLTGGYLPLAVTACHERVYEAFLGDTFATAFAHGHSYTANPLGCAAALASLTILQNPDTTNNIAKIEKIHREELSELAHSDGIEKTRYCGTIAAFDLKLKVGYGSQFSSQLQAIFLEKGLLLRPLGNVVYFLPPYCITEAELRNVYNVVKHELRGVTV